VGKEEALGPRLSSLDYRDCFCELGCLGYTSRSWPDGAELEGDLQTQGLCLGRVKIQARGEDW